MGGVITFMYKFVHDRLAHDMASSHMICQGYVGGVGVGWCGVVPFMYKFIHDRLAQTWLNDMTFYFLIRQPKKNISEQKLLVKRPPTESSTVEECGLLDKINGRTATTVFADGDLAWAHVCR